MKTTIKLLTCIALLFTLNSCFERKTGSGSIVTETRQVDAFTSIDVCNGAEVQIVRGDSQSVTVSDYENIVMNLRVVTKDSTLHIKTKPDHIWLRNSEAKVIITSPDVLNDLKITGSGDVVLVSGFSNLQKIKISGSGSVKVNPTIFPKGIEIKITGSGDIKVKGRTGHVDAKISGSGTINIQDLIAETASCKISGSGDIMVQATRTLEANISGSGDIIYVGTPIVNTHIAGSGEVTRK